jgi:hypothetical protein
MMTRVTQQFKAPVPRMFGSLIGLHSNQVTWGDRPLKSTQANANLSARFRNAVSALISKSPIVLSMITVLATTAIVFLTGARALHRHAQRPLGSSIHARHPHSSNNYLLGQSKNPNGHEFNIKV